MYTEILTVIGTYSSLQKDVTTPTQPKRKKQILLTQNGEGVDDLYINPIVVGIEFLRLAIQQYPDYIKLLQPANDLEILCTKELFSKLLTIQNEYEYIEEEVLEGDGVEEDKSINWEDEHGNPMKNETIQPNYIPIEQKKIMVDKANKHWDSRSFKWIQNHGCRKMKHREYKQIWENQIATGGTKFEKFKKIDTSVWEKFKNARQELRTIHGYDIKRWALQKFSEFPPCPKFVFTASDRWVNLFKQRHRITSRKVSKLVSKREIMNMEAIEKRCDDYRAKMKEIIPKYNPDSVINWDQTGCNYEIVSPRTLTFKGEAVTFGYARSPTNKVTHSYTVQYCISLSGKIVGKAFVCLQEPGGSLGPRIKANLFDAANILLTVSHSGKLTTSLIEYFLDNSLVPEITQKGNPALLTFDHWTGQVDPQLYESRFGKNGVPECKCEMIPERCTPFCQPLDTVFNRQYKYFLKRVTQQVQLEHEDTNENPIYCRNNIIKLQSLLHYQLSAEIFADMIRYAWFKSGITSLKRPFLNVKEVCFSFHSTYSRCAKENCDKSLFIQCSRCRKCLFLSFFS